MIYEQLLSQNKKLSELFKLIMLKRFRNYEKPFGFGKHKETLIFQILNTEIFF